MCAKLSSVCGILSKVRHYLNRNSLMLIYNSLIESRLRYGILSWSSASNKQLNRLAVLQNRAIRYICFSPIKTTLLPLYSQLNVLPLKYLIKLQQLTFMYKFHHNQLPFVFHSYCLPVSSHHYHTRNALAQNYALPRYISGYHEKTMKVIGPRSWTEVPVHTKSLPFCKTFTKAIKKQFIDELPKARPIPKQKKADQNFDDLKHLFDTDSDSDSEFFGFDCSS